MRGHRPPKMLAGTGLQSRFETRIARREIREPGAIVDPGLPDDADDTRYRSLTQNLTASWDGRS
jgi:hypothetical protein